MKVELRVGAEVNFWARCHGSIVPEEVYDYHSALNLIKAAERAFLLMPAHVRATFNDDAGAFVDFASDPANYEAAVKLGLAVPKDSRGDPAGGAAGPGGAAEPQEGALPPKDLTTVNP